MVLLFVAMMLTISVTGVGIFIVKFYGDMSL